MGGATHLSICFRMSLHNFYVSTVCGESNKNDNDSSSNSAVAAPVHLKSHTKF